MVASGGGSGETLAKAYRWLLHWGKSNGGLLDQEQYPVLRN